MEAEPEELEVMKAEIENSIEKYERQTGLNKVDDSNGSDIQINTDNDGMLNEIEVME